MEIFQRFLIRNIITWKWLCIIWPNQTELVTSLRPKMLVSSSNHCAPSWAWFFKASVDLWWVKQPFGWIQINVPNRAIAVTGDLFCNWLGIKKASAFNHSKLKKINHIQFTHYLPTTHQPICNYWQPPKWFQGHKEVLDIQILWWHFSLYLYISDQQQVLTPADIK